MKCTGVRRLLPLYIGGDLDVGKARTIFEHLRSCAACAATESELDSNRQLVRSLEPPDFDDEFYDGIRRSVLEEITARPARARGILAVLLGRRRRFVFATAAAVLVSSMTLTMLRREPVAELTVQSTAPKSAEVPPSPPESRGTDPATHDTDVTAATPTRRRHTPRAKRRVVPVEPESYKEAMPDPALALYPEDAWPETQKIEMQTSDPNIRIIWFAPKQEGAGLGRS